MTELQTIVTGMTPAQELAVFENNAQAICEGLVVVAIAYGLDTLTSQRNKHDVPLTWEKLGADRFPSRWTATLAAHLVGLADMVAPIGKPQTVTELARMIRAVDPESDLCSLENRRRLHAALGTCNRYVPAPAQRCSITHADTSNVWKRES